MAMSDADPAALVRAWGLPPGALVERTSRGTNNATWIVRRPGTRAGDGYVLRLYQNSADVAAIGAEHRLLVGLARQPLSFAIPAPIPTPGGETLVPVSDAAGPSGAQSRRALAALFPLLPGEHPRRGDPAVAHACGAALGELDVALARLPDTRPGRGIMYGDLDRIHPLVPDPFCLPDELPAAAEDAAWLRRLVDKVAGEAPSLYASLPRQIIHSDFGTGNVLMAAGRITAVLDFEFAAADVRAMDCAVGLLHSAIADVPAECLWQNVDAFGLAYASRLRLLPAEARALPALLRLRRIVSLIHRAGRWRQGLASDEEVRDNLRDTLALDGWLRAEETHLVEQAHAWQETPDSSR
jgi:Ser/Thr protein kinase RdoA (MazF antagonist)